MGEKMNNAPVFFTLAQVRFNPLLKLNEYLPTIQEKFRIERFPDFREEQVRLFSFQHGAQSASLQLRYILGDVAGSSSFVLDVNSLTFQTSAYKTFTEFSESVEKGLNILNSSLESGLDYVARVGIRYFDAVQPREQESLSDYLIPEIMSLSAKTSGLVHSLSETVSISPHGKLVTRVIIRDGQLGLPTDLLPLASSLDSRFTLFSGRHAILDSDAYNEQRQAPFDISKVMSNLVGLHDDIDQSFKQLVTDHALVVWK